MVAPASLRSHGGISACVCVTSPPPPTHTYTLTSPQAALDNPNGAFAATANAASHANQLTFGTNYASW